MSLSLLLGTELAVDLESGCRTYGISAPGRFVPQIEELGVTHVPLPALTRSWDPARDVRATRELVSALRHLRPDVLHTHNPKTGVIGRVVGRMLGVPVVVNTCHGLWASSGDRWRRRTAVHGAEVLAARFSHAELFQNATDLQTLHRWIDHRKASVVGNGTDLTRFTSDPAARGRVREELGITDHTVLVGGVGRLVAEKGIREFVEASATLRRRHGDDVAFVWVGPEDADKADAWAETSSAVHFLGERSDMPQIYNALDVFVLPSHREGFSRSGMEAAACGTAMVLSDIRGCREIGRDGVHVLLTPARDVDALAAQIDRLVADPALRSRLGKAASERAHAEFDQRRIAARSLTTYLAVARRRGLGWGEER